MLSDQYDHDHNSSCSRGSNRINPFLGIRNYSAHVWLSAVNLVVR
jgi:hypothetical protein